MMRAYNLLVGIIVAVAVYMAVAVMRHYNNQNETEEIIEPIPQILILPPHEPLEFHPLDGPNIAQPKFEIKIKNEQTDEVLEVVATLSDAEEYIKEYGEYHDDLFVYNIQTGELVLNSIKND